MRLDMRDDAVGLDQTCSAAYRFRIKSLPAHMVGECAAGVAAAHMIKDSGIEPAERRLAADIAMWKPAALLGAEACNREIEGRPAIRVSEERLQRYAEDHAGRAVVVAAMRHRVEMRADLDDTLAIGAGQ